MVWDCGVVYSVLIRMLHTLVCSSDRVSLDIRVPATASLPSAPSRRRCWIAANGQRGEGLVKGAVMVALAAAGVAAAAATTGRTATGGTLILHSLLTFTITDNIEITK